jgi:hypothetical protein
LAYEYITYQLQVRTEIKMLGCLLKMMVGLLFASGKFALARMTPGFTGWIQYISYFPG